MLRMGDTHLFERAGGHSDFEIINSEGAIFASGFSRAPTVRRRIASKAMMLTTALAIR